MIVVAALALLGTFCVRANAAPARVPASAKSPVATVVAVAPFGDDRFADDSDDADHFAHLDASDADDDAGDATTGPGARGACDCDPETIARVTATAPPLTAIIAAVDRTAGLATSDDPGPSWRRRSRWSALIPWVSIRGGNSESWRDINDPALSAISAPPTLSHALSWDVRAGWRLEDLVYDPNEPRFEAFELARKRNRRLLAAVTSRAYFTWVRASVAADRDPRWRLRAAEAAAQLDALTEGWFSRQLIRASAP